MAEAILDAEALVARTVDTALAAESEDYLTQLLERAQAAVGAYVDLEQFEDDYPDEVQLALVYTVEALYGRGGRMTEEDLESESLGDYSYRRQTGDTSHDIPKSARVILDRYRESMGNFNVTIGGHDRQYL